MGSTFVLPMGQVPAPQVLADGRLTVWVDTAESWLWASLPKEPEKWAAGTVPQWVAQAPTDAEGRYSFRLGRTVQKPVLVRRRLEPGEARALLDHIMPPVSDYEGMPAEWAQTLRLGGWYPRDVTVLNATLLPRGERRVWWGIEGLPDIEALALQLPVRWKHQGWPLDRKRTDPPGESAPLARHLAVLLAAGISPQTVTAHRAQGRALDVESLRQSMDPVIPDDATRIRLVRDGGRPYYALNAESARRQLGGGGYSSPVREVLAESVPGLVPLHVDPNHHLVVWSDGAVHSPAEVYQPDAPHIGGQWDPRFQRLLATRDLVAACTRAANRAALEEARVWEAWLDAESVESTVVTTSRSHAHGAERTVTTTRHVITLPGAERTEVWEVAAELRAHIGDTPREYTLHTTEPEALEAFRAADDHLPPVMTIAELALYLDTTKEALRKALRRARLRRYEESDLDLTGITTASAEPGWMGSVGGRYAEAEQPDNPRAAHVYDPRIVKPWWTGRPGHGPGRGHKG
ncbi:hypothetical protein ACFCWB_21745 [Streptomyces bacillaris]|uniref:hypothetical protein n=1 Tax=Streptomyces bacillaris TaxID=68179 RepID=UPI0035DE586D